MEGPSPRRREKRAWGAAEETGDPALSVLKNIGQLAVCSCRGVKNLKHACGVMEETRKRGSEGPYLPLVLVNLRRFSRNMASQFGGED